MVYFTRMTSGSGNVVHGFRFHHGSRSWSPPFLTHAEAKLKGPGQYTTVVSSKIEWGSKTKEKHTVEVQNAEHQDLMMVVRSFLGKEGTVEALRASSVPISADLSGERSRLLSEMKRLSNYSPGC